MLYALAHPLSMGVLVLSFVVGLTLHGWVQALLSVQFGDRRPALEGRRSVDPRRHLDPFGVISGLISGLGWTKPVELMNVRRRPALLATTLGGAASNLLLGAALLLGWRVAYGPDQAFSGSVAYLLQHGVPLAGLGDVLLLAGASQLYLGALSLVPLPPLDGGRLLFGLAPRTMGWRKAEHQLVERNIGIAILLALLLIPLGGPVPLLPQLLDAVLTPLLNALTGA